jgi:hypothetical protein
MTATPHNGKEADFQLFLALLDGDRFEGRFRDGVHVTDTSDLMRRMVKENLLKFDGTPLFPERIAYTVPYKLSEPEARLYKAVTDYVREEFNRAEALANDKRAGTVGFALTILRRRLASSPEAIYQSLRRRRDRLEGRLCELEVLQRGGKATPVLPATVPALGDEDFDDLYAPYLDYRPLKEDEPSVEGILARPECDWIGHEIEQKAHGYAIAHVVPEQRPNRRSPYYSSLLDCARGLPRRRSPALRSARGTLGTIRVLGECY